MDRYLNPSFLRFTCVTFIALSAAAQLVSFLTYDGGPTIFSASLGGDFTGFYTGGTILNRFPAGRLYDFGLQSSLYHELFPKEAAGTVIPFVHPPFVAQAFRPFAVIPYPAAFLTWLLISVGLYLSGLRILVAHQRNLSREHHSLAVLLAVAFAPFLLECAQGGQLSTVGFCAIVFGFHALGQGRAFLGGCILGLGLYKPPLVLLIPLFLLVSRQARAFAGFLATACALGLTTLLISGGDGIRAYLEALHSFGGWAAGRSDGFPAWKFVDVASLLAPLAKSLSIPPVAGIVVAACFLLPAPVQALASLPQLRPGPQAPRLGRDALILPRPQSLHADLRQHPCRARRTLDSGLPREAATWGRALRCVQGPPGPPDDHPPDHPPRRPNLRCPDLQPGADRAGLLSASSRPQRGWNWETVIIEIFPATRRPLPSVRSSDKSRRPVGVVHYGGR